MANYYLEWNLMNALFFGNLIWRGRNFHCWTNVSKVPKILISIIWYNKVISKTLEIMYANATERNIITVELQVADKFFSRRNDAHYDAMKEGCELRCKTTKQDHNSGRGYRKMLIKRLMLDVRWRYHIAVNDVCFLADWYLDFVSTRSLHFA